MNPEQGKRLRLLSSPDQKILFSFSDYLLSFDLSSCRTICILTPFPKKLIGTNLKYFWIIRFYFLLK